MKLIKTFVQVELIQTFILLSITLTIMAVNTVSTQPNLVDADFDTLTRPADSIGAATR